LGGARVFIIGTLKMSLSLSPNGWHALIEDQETSRLLLSKAHGVMIGYDAPARVPHQEGFGL